MNERLRRLAGYAAFPEQASCLILKTAPEVWDRLLDTDLPILLELDSGQLPEVLAELRRAGLPEDHPLRWVGPDGRVGPPQQAGQEQGLLLVGFSHPNEGWRTRLPLFGRRLLVTRAAEQASAMLDRLTELGAEAIAFPVLSFEEPSDLTVLDRAISRLESFDRILFTSPNGVRFFFSRLRHQGRDLRALGGAWFGCIGPSTAAALGQYHFDCDLVPPSFVAESFLESLLAEGVEEQRILLPRAAEAREVLPEGLRRAGAEVVVAPAYRTVIPAPPPLEAEVDLVLFTSSSTVKHYRKLRPHSTPLCACIGPITAGTARELGFEPVVVAARHTVDGLIEALVESFV